MLPATIGEITDGMISSATKRRFKGRSSRKWCASSSPSRSSSGSATAVISGGVQHRVPQALILQQAAVVQQALKVGVLIEQAQLLKADDHGIEEREQAEREQDEDRRRDQQILEAAGCRRRRRPGSSAPPW